MFQKKNAASCFEESRGHGGPPQKRGQYETEEKICNWGEVSFVLIFIFPVWLRNRLISTGLEMVFIYTEKSFIPSYYRQFSTNIKNKIIKLITVFLAPRLGKGVIYS